MTAALAVTGVLGFGVITGLNVNMIRGAVERMQAFDITLPKPKPPEPKPKPLPKPKEQGAPAAPKASPVILPKPKVELPPTQPVAAAAKPGTGASSSTGQGRAGNGSGAGGTGSGLGGGGGGGGIPARLVRNLSRSDYARLTGGRLPEGAAGLAIGIDAAGRVSSCNVEHSSGDPAIDAGLCPLVRARLGFEPARNAQGQPVPYFTHYLARWRR